MAHPLEHAKSSARRFGGSPEDYMAIHHWFDETKAHYASWRHRSLRHHTLGIFECEKVFGSSITNSDGKQVPVRVIGEQHVKEDCHGKIPTVQDWLKGIPVEPWMGRYVSTEEDRVPTTPHKDVYVLTIPCAKKEAATRQEIINALLMEVTKLQEENELHT